MKKNKIIVGPGPKKRKVAEDEPISGSKRIKVEEDEKSMTREQRNETLKLRKC